MQKEAIYYEQDIKASGKAIEIVDEWNALAQSDRHFFKSINDLRPACARPVSILQVVEPQIWTWSQESRLAGQRLMVEPYLANYEKWNSNGGWQSETAWGKVMAALSHFSYHVTNGQCLLCDLQGGISDTSGCTLTDPVICSRNRSFGLTDLGPEGIVKWFQNRECRERTSSPSLPHVQLEAHTLLRFSLFLADKCNRHCYAGWLKPKVNKPGPAGAAAAPRFKPIFEVDKSTVMRQI